MTRALWKISLSTRLLSITTGLWPILLSARIWSGMYRNHKGPLILKGAKWLWQRKELSTMRLWSLRTFTANRPHCRRWRTISSVPGLRAGPGLWLCTECVWNCLKLYQWATWRYTDQNRGIWNGCHDGIEQCSLLLRNCDALKRHAEF